MNPDPPFLPDKFDWWEAKSVLNDWFFRSFRSQATVPPGTIAAYGIVTAPEGWVLCDNTEYEQTKFPALFEVIRQTYGGAAGTFRVPNMPVATYPLPTGAAWMIKV